MRIPLAVGLESRNGERTPRDETQGYARDARIINGIVEVKGESTAVVRKRPGLVNVGSVRAGVGQLIHNWNGIRAIVDDYINSGTISTIVNTPPSSSLTPTNADLQFSAANTGSGAATPRMMFKNRSQAWTMNRAGTVSTVSYGGTMGSETYAIVSLTRVSTTATAVVASDVPFEIGDSVTIAGATPVDYNGAQTVTGVTPGVYTPERLIPITITRSGTTATATTVSGSHGLTTATAYTIAGASDSAYNGSKTITTTGADSFTYTVTVTPAPTTTWNPADKNASITLSAGDLTATNGSSSATDSKAARGTIGKASGKWYWEVTIGTVGGNIQIGAAAASESLSDYIGSGAAGWGYNNYGTLWTGGSGSITEDAYIAADVIGVALDLDSGEISFYKNGVLQHTFTGVTGTLYPAVSMVNGGVVTANFGGSAFAQTIPTGFAALASDSPSSPAAGAITVADPAVSTPATFTFTIASGNDTATGTITAQGIGGTVPGIAYLNGYFAVMDTAGTIWNSASDDPTSWGALDFLTAQNDSSRGAGIAVSRGYLVAFKEWSTEFFYDAANATGSPFSPVDSAPLQIGCATGWSIASIDDFTFWMSQTKAKGRSVHMLSGIEQKKVSTPDIDRILDDASIETVYAFCLNIDGHRLYVLTLAADTEGITLVYDSTSDLWGEWTTYESVGTSNTIVSITRNGDIATASFSDVIDGLPDGGSVTITGATQSEYNGVKQVYDYAIVEDASGPYPNYTTVSFGVRGDPLTPATTASSIVMYRGTPTQLDFVGAISFAGSVLLLSADGYIYAVEDEIFVDETRGTPSTKSRIGIDFIIRTPRLDGGTLDRKRASGVAVVGTSVNDSALIRWSDDDGATWSAYRPVDLFSDQPQIRRCGSFRRRSFEVNHAGNSSPIFEALELDISR